MSSTVSFVHWAVMDWFPAGELDDPKLNGIVQTCSIMFKRCRSNGRVNFCGCHVPLVASCQPVSKLVGQTSQGGSQFK